MRKYRDIDSTLAVHPETKDILVVTNSSAVATAMRNLVLSDRYDHPFQPSIGAGVRNMIFENFGRSTDEALSQMISEVINNHEPRVKVEKVEVFSSPNIGNLDVAIVYYEVEIPTLQTLKLTIERVRQ